MLGGQPAAESKHPLSVRRRVFRVATRDNAGGIGAGSSHKRREAADRPNVKNPPRGSAQGLTSKGRHTGTEVGGRSGMRPDRDRDVCR